MSERRAPAGILCALVTPFRDESPDLDALGELVDFQVASGTQGLFPLGTTGEGVLLDPEDRMRVAAFVVERAAGRISVIVHCGAPDTKTAATLARHAQDIGADGGATVAPYYFHYGEAALVTHFTEVATAAPEMSHYLYENPGVVGYEMGVGMVTRLVREIPTIVGIKDTGDSIGKITQYLAEPGLDIDVYTGNNVTILPALVMGANGAVSALANAVPELVTGVYGAWAEGRLDDARRLQFTLARLHGSLAGMPYVGGVKHLLSKRGLPSGETRSPQALLTPAQAETVDRRLGSFEDLTRWLEPVVASPA
jgi:4-hydroxy-tetrahydrodipicolinate synthase